MLRPETPAYAVISSTFETAAKDIMNGADVQSTLDDAVTRSTPTSSPTTGTASSSRARWGALRAPTVPLNPR